MKYIILLFWSLVFIPVLSAQSFTEALQSPPLSGVRFSAVAFSDINGDGHQDLLLSGQDSAILGSSKLYVNDGLGNFIELPNTPFDSLVAVALAFSDVNNDGAQDVLLTGVEAFSATERVAKLYTNDGLGNFTEVMETPFDGVWFGSVAFADINGDDYEDVLICGQNSADQRISKLYTNDGLGNFTEMTNMPFEGVRFSSVAFSDVNGDDAQDLLITGQNDSIERIAKLYINDGLGNFTEMANTPFIGVWESSVAFSDVNGDGFQDVLITGQDSLSDGNSKLYINDGLGNFTEMVDMPFDDIWRSTIAFSDTNDDGHPDVLLAGENNVGQRVSKLYKNDGLGDFTEILSTTFDGVRFGAIAFSDVNGDDYEDLLITGENILGELIAKLYINDGEVSPVEELEGSLPLDFTLFPNPASTNQLHILYKAPENGRIKMKVYAANGQLLHAQEEYILAGRHTFSIDLIAFHSGTYFLQLVHANRNGLVKFTIQ